jgi:hypothetical protein
MANDELHRAELENDNLHVANSVLDNCLSTLKHETMYYPSRIRQLVDSRELAPLAEVTGFYRDLYGILIQQAISQVEHIKMHVQPTDFLGQRVVGNANMLRYLVELLKPNDVQTEPKDERYVKFQLTLAGQPSHVDWLIARQIVREHGEATARRACGIVISQNIVNITLPRYNGKV